MLKKAKNLSNRYMSNPCPLRQWGLREKNKQNKDPNSTLEQNSNNQVQNCSLSETKIERPSPLGRQREKTQAKFKAQCEKQAHQLNQLSSEITRLKRQNQRLREDARRANKNNQQNIFSYEAYIKELEAERDRAQGQLEAYAEHLKFCIIWMIEAYALNQDPSQHHNLVVNKLGKQKMSQVFKKLIAPIEELQLKKKLLEIAKSEPSKNQQYLICSKEDEAKGFPKQGQPLNEGHSIEELNDMLNTFDLQHFQGHNHNEQYRQTVARKLFVNEDTFGEEIGEHSISQEYDNDEDQKAFRMSSRSIEKLIGAVVVVKAQFKNESDDYLKVKKGDQIKLLKKVGDLWIAEKGCQIGYITEHIFL